MCFTCTLEEVTGIDSHDLEDGWTPELVAAIEWPEATNEMKLLARLRWALYECTSAVTGGPMHVFTDDYNVDDENVEGCARFIEEDEPYDEHREDWPLVQAISRRMVELARPMSTAERAVALSLSWGELWLDAQGKVTRQREEN